MNKNLKQYIKDKKLSDEQILKILQSTSESESEKDVKDEEDESESVADSKEQPKAESKPAEKEDSKKKDLSMEEFSKFIKTSVAEALKAEKEKDLLPSQKPVKKDEPKPKPDNMVGFKVGEFNLVM